MDVRPIAQPEPGPGGNKRPEDVIVELRHARTTITLDGYSIRSLIEEGRQ
jgi:hypothetical protein